MDLIEAVFNAGIVGEGGAGFPTWAKLKTKADCFIINAAECEPLIETDKYFMREFPREIIAGTVASARQVGASRIVIGIKSKYHREIESLKNAIKEQGENVEIFEMPSFYPAGDEHVLVYLITGKSIPARGLPLDVGCVVGNVGTMRSVFHAMDGQPVTHKYLSVTGAVKEPILMRVPIGTHFRECVNAAGPQLERYAVISGGPMMGAVISDQQKIDEAVVTKTTGNIMVLPEGHSLIQRTAVSFERIRLRSRSACIQCRFCTDLCPRYLIGQEMEPHKVMRGLWCEDMIKSDEEYLKTFGEALNCSGCGVCEMFSCPMNLSPRRVNEYFKGVLRAKGLDQKPNQHPQANRDFMHRLVPTERLAARLDLLKYYPLRAEKLIDYVPKEVWIPFKQSIGKPAVPTVEEGCRITCGQLIGKAQEGLSSNIAASMDGTVTEINALGARIAGGGE